MSKIYSVFIEIYRLVNQLWKIDYQNLAIGYKNKQIVIIFEKLKFINTKYKTYISLNVVTNLVQQNTQFLT